MWALCGVNSAGWFAAVCSAGMVQVWYERFALPLVLRFLLLLLYLFGAFYEGASVSVKHDGLLLL